MTKISKEYLPMSKFNHNLKLYWNMKLTHLSKGQKIMWEWRAAGRPRGYDSEVYRIYTKRLNTLFKEKREELNKSMKGVMISK